MSVVIRGKLSVKVHGMLKQKQLSGSWAVLYDGGGKGNNPPCIELFEEQKAQSPVHTIVLEHLKFSDKSYRYPEPFFMLSIRKEKHHFECESQEEKEDWVQSLCHVSQELWQQRASAKESSDFDESEASEDMCDNLLYDSCDKVQQFKVSINPNKASEANNLRGHFMLNPTQDSLRLLEIDSSKSVHEWPYRQMRKFGNTRRIFKMEVGRRCTTGEGEFEFFTPDGSTLAKLITDYTRQMYNQESKRPQAEVASSSPVGDGDHSGSLAPSRNSSASNSSPQRSPVAQVSSRLSRISRDSREDDYRLPERGSVSSQDAKREVPKPAPRSIIKRSKKEDGATGVKNKVGHSSADTKIYETSSGLTAPLESHLKHELQSKLHAQPSDHQEASVHDSCTVIEGDPVSDTFETSNDAHGSSESMKDKKKSEKERKKLEKEQKAAEAKLKKQQEKEEKQRAKELKEKKEREAKEEKERLKKMKKESKSHEKLKSKKSLDIPAPTPARLPDDNNIYDEPEELIGAKKPASTVTADPGYSDADEVAAVLAKHPTPADHEVAVGDVYSTPQKPKKDSWKTHARPESDHVHQENYNSIKQASLSHSKSQRPPVPAFLPPSCEDDVEETYNHLGDFRPPDPPPENVYGMASGKDIILETCQPPAPRSAFAGGHEYEEACDVCPGLRSGQ